LHLIDGTQEKVSAAYNQIRDELETYGHGVAEKPEIVGLNKIDALDPDAVKKALASLKRAAKKRSPNSLVLALSGAAGTGVTDVLRALAVPVGVRRAADRAEREAMRSDDDR
jgi:GTPase